MRFPSECLTLYLKRFSQKRLTENALSLQRVQIREQLMQLLIVQNAVERRHITAA